jgi:hypothetical protein
MYLPPHVHSEDAEMLQAIQQITQLITESWNYAYEMIPCHEKFW